MQILPTAAALASLFVATACAAPDPVSAGQLFSFEDDAVGALPRGFVAAETNGAGAPAAWQVTAGLDPEDPGHVVSVATTNTGQTYNLLLSGAEFPADLRLSVFVFARAGVEDQGGGLLWRARDADNYYVARWNPLEDNLRLYTVVDGERTLLASADVAARPEVWHRLEVRTRGESITLRFDGVARLEVRDGTFADAGHVGLWTKADAATLFDRLEVVAIESGR